MPTISMFYGIVIYLYFYDDERQRHRIFTPSIKAKMLLFQSLTENFWPAAFHWPSYDWFRHGLKSTGNL